VDGKRKSYFNPFGFMAVCIAVVIFMNNIIKPYGSLPEPDPFVIMRIPDEKMRDLYVLTVERNNRVQRFANSNLNTLAILLSPYFAGGLYLFFRRRKRNVAELTVGYIILSAFSNVAATFLFSPVLAVVKDTDGYFPVLILSLFLQTVYISIGMKTLLSFRGASGFWKVLGSLMVIGVAGFIVLMIAYFWYVYRGDAWGVLRYL
jgi:hypothetical protein